MSFKSLVVTIVITWLLSFSLSFTQTKKELKVINQFKDSSLTLKNVALAIVALDIRYPEWVFRQSIRESGWVNKTYYKSQLANIGNNLFGMRKPSRRKTYALEKKMSGYATFSYWIYSLLDYKLWQNINLPKKNENYGDYLIRRNYAANNKRYVKHLFRLKIPYRYIKILEKKGIK